MNEPGSYAYLRSVRNYVVHIVRKACLNNRCTLGILGQAGADFLDCEVVPRLEAGFECRKVADVEAYYSNDRSGVVALEATWGGWCFPPAILAAYHGDIQALALLKAAGHDLTEADSWSGKTPAYMAARGGHAACLSLLKAAGCNLEQATLGGETPAHIAASLGHKDCLLVLMRAGCDLGQADSDGETPAHMAASGGHDNCLRVLIEAGCNLEQADHNGRTPADIAAEDDDCLRVLQTYD